MKKLIIILISVTMNSQSIDLINSKQNIGMENWSIVNDDVMGGISKSKLSMSDENNLMFTGYLSLENNGGFASTRHRFKEQTLASVKSFKIKLKGDGNSYKLRIRQNNRRASYSADFVSTKDKWTELEILIKDFKPTWRGFTYSDYPDLDIEKISELGIQISDKQEGEFMLEIEYIKAMY